MVADDIEAGSVCSDERAYALPDASAGLANEAAVGADAAVAACASCRSAVSDDAVSSCFGVEGPHSALDAVPETIDFGRSTVVESGAAAAAAAAAASLAKWTDDRATVWVTNGAQVLLNSMAFSEADVVAWEGAALSCEGDNRHRLDRQFGCKVIEHCSGRMVHSHFCAHALRPVNMLEQYNCLMPLIPNVYIIASLRSDLQMTCLCIVRAEFVHALPSRHSR